MSTINSLASLRKRWDEVGRGPAEHFGVEGMLENVAQACDDNAWEPAELADRLYDVATDINALADAVSK